MHRVWRGAVWAAYAWALVNCLYVYLVAGGGRVYRVETAAIIYVAVLLPLVLRARAPDARDSSGSSDHVHFLLIGAVGLWLLTLAPLVAFPFLSDDYVFLERYRTAPSLLHSEEFFRPLFGRLFWFVRKVGGSSPTPFHVIALCLHAASTVAVYALGERVLRSSAKAAVAAAVFLLNPLQLEATVWISGLQDGLWTFFLLAAAVVYSGRPTVTASRLALTVTLIAAALLSKETAVCFVLVLPLIDLAVGRSIRERSVSIAYVVFAAELVGYLALRSHGATSFDQQFMPAPTRYVLKQFVTTPYRVFLFPWNAAAVQVPLWMTCAIAMVALTALLRASSRPAVPLLLGPLLVLASTLPLAGYFYVGADLMSARYLYFGAVGWSLFVAEVIARVAPRRKVQLTIACVLLLGSFVALRLNLRPWRTVADLIETADAARLRHIPVRDAIASWQKLHGVELQVNDEGVPLSYKGVYIFTNGYAEFVRGADRH